MFLDFFLLLKKHNLKVSLTEWILLIQALEQGHGHSSLTGFYYLCRATCIKNEALYDTYDQCFAHFFKDSSPPQSVKDDFMQWLEKAKPPKWMEQDLSQFKSMDQEQMREEFEKRLKEQKGRHDGGSHWIGTGGTSAFGNSGYHPDGIRVGGESMSRSASQIASKRAFKDLRKDRIIDTRAITLALKKLRLLGRSGVPEELDLDGTIAATAKNVGDLHLKFQPSRKNDLKLLLLMDVGGSMTEHTMLCEKLFSAANSMGHFKVFRYHFFHNCPYDYLFHSMESNKLLSTKQLLKEVDESWRLIMVGDAAMNPYELTAKGGCIDYFQYNEDPGVIWIKRIKENLPKSVWLNPEPKRLWSIASNQIVRSAFGDMYPLTLEGVEEAVKHLNK